MRVSQMCRVEFKTSDEMLYQSRPKTWNLGASGRYVARWLDGNIEDGFAIYQFPKEHWKKIRTSNGIERLKKEIKRRTRVAVLFPNTESLKRQLAKWLD